LGRQDDMFTKYFVQDSHDLSLAASTQIQYRVAVDFSLTAGRNSSSVR
jgi:hypothetical protein